jgi:hypothetical protein
LVGRNQAERGEPHDERIRAVACREAQRDIQRILLPLRQRLEAIEQRRAELIEPRERELHLGLHAGDVRHTESGRLTSGVPEQRRLPMPASPRTTRATL